MHRRALPFADGETEGWRGCVTGSGSQGYKRSGDAAPAPAWVGSSPGGGGGDPSELHTRLFPELT